MPTDRLSHEFEAVGFFLTGHPLDDYQDVLEALGAETWMEFAAKARTRRVVGTLAGTVLHARERQGKSGNAYAFVAFSDPTGQFEAVVFSETLAASRAAARAGNRRAARCRGRGRRRERQGAGAAARLAGQGGRSAPCRHEDLCRGRARAGPAGRAGGIGRRPGPVPPRAAPRRRLREVEFVLPQGIDATPKQRSALKLVEGVAGDQRALGPSRAFTGAGPCQARRRSL